MTNRHNSGGWIAALLGVAALFSTPVLALDAPNRVDLMLLYDDLLISQYGKDIVEADIREQVEILNDALARSGANLEVEIADVLPVAGLDDMQWGRFNEFRGTADIVGAIRAVGRGYCGYGALGGRPEDSEVHYYFWVQYYCMKPSPITFAHEFGHVMGLAHNMEVPDNYARMPFAHGWVTPTCRGDIMSYACHRYPVFSSPNIVINGEVMGNAEVADNVRALNLTGPIVSQYRTRDLFSASFE